MTTKKAAKKPTLCEKDTAYHEAGHAVVGYLLGRNIKFISIDLVNHPILGNSSLDPKFTPYAVCHFDADDITNHYFLNYFMKAAGYYAGKRGVPNYRNRCLSFSADYEYLAILREIAKDLDIDSYDILAVERFLMKTTNLVLEKEWAKVELVANALLEKKFLTREEAKAILPEDPDPEIFEIMQRAEKTVYDMLKRLAPDESKVPQYLEADGIKCC
jgi:hypothetical protein